jgi:hypothetical protein
VRSPYDSLTRRQKQDTPSAQFQGWLETFTIPDDLQPALVVFLSWYYLPPFWRTEQPCTLFWSGEYQPSPIRLSQFHPVRNHYDAGTEHAVVCLNYPVDLLPNRPAFFNLFKYFTLEAGLGSGFILILIGVLLIVRAANLSYSPGFDSIGFGNSIRLVFGGALSLITGGQIILTSFVLSMLGLNAKA